MLKILNIVGARPNFMKVAPLHRAFKAIPGISSKIVHTGQHYDARMSDIFFNQLGLPEPHHYLGVGTGSHTQVTATVMMAFEKVVEQEQPDLILVVGDVNSTVACMLVATKMGIPLAHVEAGLRSGDRTMPEELNRVLTDSVSDFLFVTEHSGLVNLAKEGVPDERVFFVGNVMIDSLVHFREKAASINLTAIIPRLFQPPNHPTTQPYALMTMHRPSNVDNQEGLEAILQIIKDTSKHLPVVFPIHPRTLNRLKQFDLFESLQSIPSVELLEPQGYLEFLKLMENATLIITDSGGIQEETTYLQVPCLTFRDSTERPITVELGTNILMKDLDPVKVRKQVSAIMSGQVKQGTVPPLWDGHAAERIAEVLLNYLNTKSTKDTENTWAQTA